MAATGRTGRFTGAARAFPPSLDRPPQPAGAWPEVKSVCIASFCHNIWVGSIATVQAEHATAPGGVAKGRIP